MLTTVFTWKSEINLIKHDSEGMFNIYITNIIEQKGRKLLVL